MPYPLYGFCNGGSSRRNKPSVGRPDRGDRRKVKAGRKVASRRKG